MRITDKVLITVFSYGVTTVVGFLGTLYFTNRLGAALYGQYILGMTIVKWLLVGDLGFRKATKKRLSEGSDINDVYATSLAVQLAQAAIIVLVLLVLQELIDQYVGGEFSTLVIALFVTTLGFELIGMGLSGTKRVHVWKSVDAFSEVGRVVVQASLVVLGYQVVGLFLGHITALLVAAVIAVLFLFYRSELGVGTLQWNQFRSLLRYARFSWLERIRSQTFAWMDILVLGFFVTSSVVATYQVAWTISMTFGILSSSLSQTLFPELSGLDSDNKTERISSLLSEGFVYAAFIPIPGFFGTLALGQQVLALFGPEFTDGFPLLVSLAALSIVLSFDKQLRTVIDSLNYPQYTFRINALFILLNLGLNLVLIYDAGALGAAIASLLSISATSVYSLYLLRGILEFDIPVYDIGLQFFGGGVMFAVVSAVTQIYPPTNPIATILFAGFGVVIYISIMVGVSSEIRQKAVEVLNKLNSSTAR